MEVLMKGCVVLFLTLCAAPAYGQAGGDVGPAVADAALPSTVPWTFAFADHFIACAEAAGHTFLPDERNTLGETLRASGTRFVPPACLANDDAMAACARDVRARPCDDTMADMQRELDPPADPPPEWAQLWARTLRNKILQCYAIETGQPLDASSSVDDLDHFAHTMASALGQLGAACTLKKDKFDTCVATMTQLDCGVLGSALAEQGSPLQSLLTACKGFLQCGLDTGDDDGSRIEIPGVDAPATDR
jgi:hypothetical protein